MEQQGDIKFFYDSTTANTLGYADIQIDGVDLVRDPGFETSVLIALFSDGRADPEDALPDPKDSRRGWWGDALLEIPFKSKLWLLERAKLTDETLSRAEEYAKTALAYLVVDGIADDVQAVATRGGANQIDFVISIIRNNDRNIFFKFYINWQFQIFGGLS